MDSGPKAGRTGLRVALLAIGASATLAAAGCEKSEPDIHPPTVPTPTVTAPGAGTTATQPAPATPTAPAPAPPQQP